MVSRNYATLTIITLTHTTMKRSLILIAALFSILCCWAEDSRTPTVDILTIDATAKYGPKMWSMYYENDEGAREMDAVFEVGKDSTLNGHRYLKIIINAASYVETERDTLLYRQENGKVFFVPKGEKKEILLLNYDLEVNDVFVYPDGTAFRVEHKGPFDELPCERVSEDDVQPRILELKSLDGAQTDIWMEGVGSIYWGIFPFLPKDAQVFFSSGKLMEVFSPVDKPNYKKQYSRPDMFDNAEDNYAYLRGEYDNRTICYFIGDTLCVKGCKKLAGGTPVAVKCLLEGNNITIQVIDANPYSFKFAEERQIYFNVKFPHFPAGTYFWGTETLTCQGETGLKQISDIGKETEGSRAYDLQGRPVSGKQRRGLYIRGGRVRVAE